MIDEKLTADIKIRAPEGLKEKCQQYASERHLELSDIVREALREYVAKRETERKALLEQTKAA
jgi:predicted transcriptional regulator